MQGQTRLIEHPGQRQRTSAASALNAKSALWFDTHHGALTGEIFARLLNKWMCRRKKPVLLILDGLRAHKNAAIRD